MSDPTTLIPNLTEIMEEYTELKNQTEQDSQVPTVQVEDRDDENEKQQQTREESRKRKRGADEARAEQRKDSARNFISEKAAALMERSLKDRGFIAERLSRSLDPDPTLLADPNRSPGRDTIYTI